MKIDLNMHGELYNFHNFNKKNLVTNADNTDTYICEDCGIEGKRYGLSGTIKFGRVSKKKLYHCNGTKGEFIPEPTEADEATKTGQQVRVIMDVHLGGFDTENGDILDVVDTPKGESSKGGLWVINKGKFDSPFMVLNGEYEEI